MEQLKGPILEAVIKSNNEVDLLKIDVDEFDEIAADYNVTAMPTVLFLKNGIGNMSNYSIIYRLNITVYFRARSIFGFQGRRKIEGIYCKKSSLICFFLVQILVTLIYADNVCPF